MSMVAVTEGTKSAMPCLTPDSVAAASSDDTVQMDAVDGDVDIEGLPPAGCRQAAI